MNVDQIPYRTIWTADDGWRVRIIDQTRLPHNLVILELENIVEMAEAIKIMRVRGAPLIGASAAYGIALAMNESPTNQNLDAAVETLSRTRPTAVNLHWALTDMKGRLAPLAPEHRVEAAYRRAAEICDEDTEINRRIGEHALPLIKSAASKKKAGRERKCFDPL